MNYYPEVQKRYKASAKGRAAQARYENTEKARARKRRYAEKKRGEPLFLAREALVRSLVRLRQRQERRRGEIQIEG